ncbi:MAG: DNA polymerase III subunit delta, partial [Chloroflexi bacterium]|nr:DNA polymerase III subunit delta [Chloroflexota bacterium]
VTLNQLRPVCETLPFLAGKRLVIIKGLLERFEVKGRPSRQPKTTRTSQPDEYKSLGDYISKVPDSTVVVLLDGRIASNNPLFKALAGKAVVKSFPLLKEAQLRQWLRKRVAEEGGSMSPQAVDLLAKLVGSNLWVIASEITKLVLFTSGRRIEEDDVKALVSHTQQANVFAMVDAIVEFQAELAEQLLQRLLQSGTAPAFLLVMLSRQVQMIARAKELGKQRKPATEIQSRLGLPSEFALRKTLEQAGRYSLARLRGVYQQLLETDLSIKTGKYGDELALNILVAELCQGGKTDVTHPSHLRK